MSNKLTLLVGLVFFGSFVSIFVTGTLFGLEPWVSAAAGLGSGALILLTLAFAAGLKGQFWTRNKRVVLYASLAAIGIVFGAFGWREEMPVIFPICMLFIGVVYTALVLYEGQRALAR